MFAYFSNPRNVLHLSSKVLGAGLALLLAGIYGAIFTPGICRLRYWFRCMP